MASQVLSITERIGHNIRSARVAAKLNQRELARLIGGRADGTDVSRYERGAVRPGDDRLARIAEVLKRDVAWFYIDHTPEREAA